MAVMDKRERETLGVYLRREREARNIKLGAISKATKISLPLLVALEADDQGAFQDKKAVPDYLKRYCRYLLMDEQEALKHFESQPIRHCLPEATELPLADDLEMSGPEITALSPPEVDEDPLPTPIAHTSYVLPPSVISSAKEPGFFHRFRLFFVSAGVLVIMFVIFSGLLFYFHPLREMAAKKEGIKVEAPQKAAVKSPPPAVKKEKVIGNRDSKRYHLPGMIYYRHIEAYHRVEFDSEAAAIRAGYHKAPR
jgi:hypothetical protein